MTACRSFLHARALPGRRTALVQAFVAHRVLEQCQEAVPGCLSGELLLSPTDPDALCVTVLWATRADHEAWIGSPLRVTQGLALGPFVAEMQPPVLMPVAATLPGETGQAP
ncbi:MAG: antibiotic biosynthesis monooxygenase [Rubrivivax sp.]|nr:antibiotic biosynthesis monooxygenase [Rubrivivax sp.]